MKFKRYIVENSIHRTKKDETGHIHDVSVDANGDGKTTSIDNKKSQYEQHEHLIHNWMIQIANKHVHNMDI